MTDHGSNGGSRNIDGMAFAIIFKTIEFDIFVRESDFLNVAALKHERSDISAIDNCGLQTGTAAEHTVSGTNAGILSIHLHRCGDMDGRKRSTLLENKFVRLNYAGPGKFDRTQCGAKLECAIL